MKILKKAILMIAAFSVVLFSGCDSDEELQYATVTEVRENFSKSVEKVKSREYDNLDFGEAKFSFPEIDSISSLSLNNFSGKSVEEIYYFFSDSLDSLAPGEFSDEQKSNEIRFYDGKNPDGTRPTILEYTPTDNPWPYVEGDDCFMDMRYGVLRCFDNADLMRWSGETGKPIMKFMITNERRTKEIITDLDCTDKYPLTDGEMSVKDAVDFANNYLETTKFSPYELSARKTVVAVNVVDIGNGKYGFNFIITPEYKNVLFDYPEMNGGVGVRLTQNSYDTRRYDVLPGTLDMIKTDAIYHFISPAYGFSIEETQTYDSIITLESAARAVSNFYSGSMDLHVKRVEAVYLPYQGKAEPCWKFLMSCTGNLYNTFVNMNTGEIYVYIQG